MTLCSCNKIRNTWCVHINRTLLSVCRILRNGSAFTYLDLENQDRNLSMVKDLNIRWIFSESHVQHHHWTFRKEISVHGYTIALWESDITSIQTSCIEAVCSPDEWKMAYTVQTSGTTGYPKIVRVPHRCIVPNIQSLQ
jgi:long-subunit acyl-CoA synthetase (AMP-forming)